MSIDFTSHRQSYDKGQLSETTAPKNPYFLLESWLNQAIAENLPEPYAFALATCGADNMPAVRTLLMRQMIEQTDGVGLIFYSNYDSQKGQDLADNPNAEALFFWHALERQIRLTGTVSKLTEADSIAYFNSRPFESQLAAWVSAPQSGVVDSRAVMESRFEKLSAQYGGGVVPKPPYWGGYCLTAHTIEFWQGGARRMHDRLRYRWCDGVWAMVRLLP